MIFVVSHVLPSDGVVALRLWSRDDAGFLVDACTDPKVRRYNAIPTPFSIAEARAVIQHFAERWTAGEADGKPSGVAFGIVDASSGEPLGQCGIDDWSASDVAQIGYWLAAPARGRGYATRSVILLTRWLFDLGAARVFLTIVADNDASLAVARRAGFVYEGTMRSQDVWQGRRFDVMGFAALPHEWSAAALGDDNPSHV
jgi:RimJ/RimL family protein N-acetyltransferase